MRYYQYQRQDFTFRCSTMLDDLLEEASDILGTTKNDVLVYLLAEWLDPTENCPDWAMLPPQLLAQDGDTQKTIAMRQYITRIAQGTHKSDTTKGAAYHHRDKDDIKKQLDECL